MAVARTGASGLGATIYDGSKGVLTADADAVRRAQEDWTYKPRTEIGRDVLSVIGAAASPLVSGMEHSRGGLGDFGYSLTGSPTVAAALYTVPDATLTLLAPETRLVFGSVGGGLFDGSAAVARYLGESLFDGPSPGSLASQRGSISMFDISTSEGRANSVSGLRLRESLAGEAGIPRSFDTVWGSSLDDLKATYTMDGYSVADKAPRASSSGNAQIFTVKDHPEMDEVQYSPASENSTHKGEYYKFTYGDGSKVKVIDPATYYSPNRNPESNTTFFDRSGNQLVYNPVTGIWSKL